MSGCAGTHDAFNGDFDCGYSTTLDCEECKYGAGRKDPEAWVNAHDEDRREHSNELRRIRRAKLEVVAT